VVRTRFARLLMVGALFVLCALGVPAVLSAARPNRERRDVGIVLLATGARPIGG